LRNAVGAVKIKVVANDEEDTRLETKWMNVDKEVIDAFLNFLDAKNLT
jgi:hypothetical protein